MNTVSVLLVILAVVSIAYLLACWSQGFRRRRYTPAANIGEGTHEGALSKFADAALTARFLLVKFGSDADHIAIAGANDKPLGICPDEVATADIAERKLAVQLLGISKSTMLAVASEAIALTDDLYTAAGGKVQNLPAGAGTYYKIGRPLQTAAADGDVLEFEPCYPVAVVVP